MKRHGRKPAMVIPLVLWLAMLAHARPAPMSEAARDSVIAAIEKDRADTIEWLKSSATSYLATVYRKDFDDRTTLTIGRDPTNDLKIDDPSIMSRHLRITVAGDSFWVEGVDPGATFVAGDDTLTASKLAPSRIAIGRYLLRLSHQRFPGIIVFDPKSPRFAEFKGMQWFPPDLEYRFELPLTANPNPDTVIILSTRGNQRRAVRVGWFDFKVGGKKCRLEASRLLEPGVGESDIGIFFRDRTSGRETYGIGRYLDPVALPDGRFVVDFNMAYNPACAYSDHYNCPIPPKANDLKVAIKAGEKDSHYLK
jgi:hypothetical protein